MAMKNEPRRHPYIGEPITKWITKCMKCGKEHKITNQEEHEISIQFYICDKNTYIYGINGRKLEEKE